MFECGVCHKTSKPRERIGGRIPTHQREVAYATPLMDHRGHQLVDGPYQSPRISISTGVETVREVMTCASCAASPPDPLLASQVTRKQPPRVVYPKYRGQENIQEGT